MKPAQDLTVKVVEGPDGMFGEGSFFRRLVEEATHRPVTLVDSRDRADLLVGSYVASPLRSVAEALDSFLSRRRGRTSTVLTSLTRRASRSAQSGTRSLWFTTENIRPPAGIWDLTLSFDADALNGTNVYCPLWWGEVSLFNDVSSIGAERLGHQLTLQSLTTPRRLVRLPKRFACAFINNPEPMRLHALRALSQVGGVDVYGRLSGKRVPHKQDVAQHYRFSLCFENDLYPGYVTEKPFEAWASGTVPLWRGLDPTGLINQSALVNAADSGGIDAAVDRVAHLESNLSAYAAVYEQPILSGPPDLSFALHRISQLFAEAP